MSRVHGAPHRCSNGRVCQEQTRSGPRPDVILRQGLPSTPSRPYPDVNSFVDGRRRLCTNHYHDIGVAVSSTEQGAGGACDPRRRSRLSMAEIEAQISELAGKAQRSQASSSPSFTGGVLHHLQRRHSSGRCSRHRSSIPPQQRHPRACTPSKKRPVVVDDEIVIRPMMYLALSYDHRLIDGQRGRDLPRPQSSRVHRETPNACCWRFDSMETVTTWSIIGAGPGGYVCGYPSRPASTCGWRVVEKRARPSVGRASTSGCIPSQGAPRVEQRCTKLPVNHFRRPRHRLCRRSLGSTSPRHDGAQGPDRRSPSSPVASPRS